MADSATAVILRGLFNWRLEFFRRIQGYPLSVSTSRSLPGTVAKWVNQHESADASFDQFYLELKDSDPAICAEIESAGQNIPTSRSMESIAPPITLRTIVLTTGRPVLDIKAGATVVAIEEVESPIWKQRLTAANSLIAPNIPAVGRIELASHPCGIPWLGTGWLIRDNVVVTNRHVAEVFGEASGQAFMFRPGLDNSPMRANIDFLEEFDSERSQEFPLFKIMHIERGGGGLHVRWRHTAGTSISPLLGRHEQESADVSVQWLQPRRQAIQADDSFGLAIRSTDSQIRSDHEGALRQSAQVQPRSHDSPRGS